MGTSTLDRNLANPCSQEEVLAGRDGPGVNPCHCNRRGAICSDAVCHIHLPVKGIATLSQHVASVKLNLPGRS
jgi:hypothetical protein